MVTLLVDRSFAKVRLVVAFDARIVQLQNAILQDTIIIVGRDSIIDDIKLPFLNTVDFILSLILLRFIRPW